MNNTLLNQSDNPTQNSAVLEPSGNPGRMTARENAPVNAPSTAESVGKVNIDAEVRSIFDSRPVNAFDFLVRGSVTYPESDPVVPPVIP